MFYCFSCMSCMLFLWSLLLAVCTNIAVSACVRVCACVCVCGCVGALGRSSRRACSRPGPGGHARQEEMAACMWRGVGRGEGRRVRRGGRGGQVNEMSDEEEIVEYVENVMGAWLVVPGLVSYSYIIAQFSHAQTSQERDEEKEGQGGRERGMGRWCCDKRACC